MVAEHVASAAGWTQDQRTWFVAVLVIAATFVVVSSFDSRVEPPPSVDDRWREIIARAEAYAASVAPAPDHTSADPVASLDVLPPDADRDTVDGSESVEPDRAA